MKDLIGKEFKVLDDGFIRVVDTMGDDSAIVQAARISYGEGTKSVQSDTNLIRYLMRHNHTSPFEMCELKLHVRVPMDVWRQWIRHRTANVNEYSTRYSVAIDSMQRTPANKWRKQSEINKQGSDDECLSSNLLLSAEEADLHEQIKHIYKKRLILGVAREQARKDLPLSTYTEAYWKIDLHNLLHFLQLRMDSHAQEEIRQYASIIGEEIVAKWTPITWQAFLDYKVNSLELSAKEVEIIASMFPRINPNWPTFSASPERKAFTFSKREKEELNKKIIKLNLPFNFFMSAEEYKDSHEKMV